MHHGKVKQVRVADFLDESCCLSERTVDVVARTIAEQELRVVVVILSHEGSVRARYRLVKHVVVELQKLTALLPVEIAWSIQGQAPRSALHEVSESGAIVSTTHGTARSGKAEHARAFARGLLGEGLCPDRTFVVTLDDDYVMFDWLNVFMMFAPWVLGRADPRPTRRGTPGEIGFSGIGVTKGGGPRVALPPGLRNEIAAGRRPPITFGALCSGVLEPSRATTPPTRPHPDSVIAPDTLSDHWAPSDLGSLASALQTFTSLGGRSSRALSLYLASGPRTEFRRSLTQFSFLLHGDQGTTLRNWTTLQLGSGYDLEVSLLVDALFHQRRRAARIANVITIPHSHLPRDDNANREMGVHLFDLVQDLEREVAASSNEARTDESHGLDEETDDFWFAHSDLYETEFVPRRSRAPAPVGARVGGPPSRSRARRIAPAAGV